MKVNPQSLLRASAYIASLLYAVHQGTLLAFITSLSVYFASKILATATLPKGAFLDTEQGDILHCFGGLQRWLDGGTLHGWRPRNVTLKSRYVVRIVLK